MESRAKFFFDKNNIYNILYKILVDRIQGVVKFIEVPKKETCAMTTD